MKSSSIITRINKLLALSESPNEFEASSALLKAQELLAKHNLSLADVEGQSVVDDIVIYGSVQSDYGQNQWKLKLATVIADNFKCYAIGRRAKSSIVFIGTEVDVKVAESLYAFTTRFIETVCTSSGLTDAKFSSDYISGFIDGLKHKFDSQRKTNKWELALSKPNKVKEEYDKIMKKAKVNNKRNINLVRDSSVYEKGYSDGQFYSPYNIEQRDLTPALCLKYEYRKNINEFFQNMKCVPWLECFRSYPSYRLKETTVECLYNNAKTIFNRMENLEANMREEDISAKTIREFKEIRQICIKVATSFYRAFHTPQSNIEIKQEYELQYSTGLKEIENYLELSTQNSN